MALYTEIRKVQCEQRDIEYQLTRKKVKNINLRLKPDGQIYVSANNQVPAEYIDNFIKEKQEYIISVLHRYEEKRKYDTSIIPRQYEDGEYFNILGDRLYLKVIEGREESIKIDCSIIYLNVKNKGNLKRKEKVMNDWIKEMQTKVFNEICREVYQKFEKYKIEFPIIKIRKMKSIWGSCQPRKGIITLNSKLIEAPITCIEYVVLHEFAHFIHPNHSKKFHEFVTELMPDWKERKKELDYIWK